MQKAAEFRHRIRRWRNIKLRKSKGKGEREVVQMETSIKTIKINSIVLLEIEETTHKYASDSNNWVMPSTKVLDKCSKESIGDCS